MDLNWKLMLYQTVNFIVLMIILGYIFNRFIRPFMHKRANDIKTAFAEIEAGKKEVEKLRQDYTEQIREMRHNAKAEIDKAIENGNAMRDELITRAEKESINILEKAKREIDHEKQKALTEIQKEVATLSIQAAQQLIHRQMDDATNRKLVEEFLEDLEKNPKAQS
jgi:F-type H+-transporting ATPase subunit b